MTMRLAATAAGVAIGLSIALPALANPQSDFNAVYGDWKADHVVTPCAWTQVQLQNAYNVATQSPDFQYSTDFTDDVHREIQRWKSGGCNGTSTLKTQKKSPLFGAHITKVSGRGGPAREFVKIKNRGKKAVSFRKARLLNGKRGRGAVFPSRFKLRRGKTALVTVGCAPGRRHAYFKGTKVWLCRRTQLFRDRGDVARLADAKGVIVSQRGFGSQRRRAAY